MSSTSGPNTLQLFKKVYGDMTDLLPKEYPFQKDIPFEKGSKGGGDTYVEAVVLTAETGWSILGSSAEMHELNPAIAGAVRQTEIKPYETVLASLIPWGVISRTQNSEGAFYSATKHVVRNNLRSHGKLLEILRIYGQAPMLLGYVSYATATYRGVALTNGTGTINGIAYTNGVNVAQKRILFAPGNFASGVWVGTEGAIVQQVDVNGVVVAQGKLVGVDATYGSIQVDFVPIPTTSTTSHRICFEGQAVKKDAPGIIAILSATGDLFGINTSVYSLWKGNVTDMGGKRLTLEAVNGAIAAAVDRGSLDGDIDLYVPARTWAKLLTTEMAYRKYDSSYSSKELETGAEALSFYSQTGKIRIKSNRFLMEGIALGLHLDDWSRSGSAEISFRVPGSSQDLIFPLQNSTAWAFRSYSDQYIFCHSPAKSMLFTGINDESAT